MNPFRYRALIFALAITAACGSVDMANTPLHTSPLFRTGWNGGPIIRSGGPVSDLDPVDGDFRHRTAAFARNWFASGTPGDDRGSGLVAAVLRDPAWRTCASFSGLVAIVEAAQKKNAYRTGSELQVGDIALFHNQVDRNANGREDDWFTGAGIVVETQRGRCTVVTETGGIQRRIVLSPDGPMTHMHDGSVINSFIRRPARFDPPDAEYLSGQLYAGYIDVSRFGHSCAEQAE